MRGYVWVNNEHRIEQIKTISSMMLWSEHNIFIKLVTAECQATLEAVVSFSIPTTSQYWEIMLARGSNACHLHDATLRTNWTNEYLFQQSGNIIAITAHIVAGFPHMPRVGLGEGVDLFLVIGVKNLEVARGAFSKRNLDCDSLLSVLCHAKIATSTCRATYIIG